MKCNVSIDGECLYGWAADKPPLYHLKYPSDVQTEEEIEEFKKKINWMKNNHFITSNGLEIKRVPISLIKCDGEKGKEGCPYKNWK